MGNRWSNVYLDDVVYALGERKTHVTESEEAGRLRSTAADLIGGGFAWHHLAAPGTSAYDLAKAAVTQLPAAVLADGFDAILYATCLPINGSVADVDAWRADGDVSALMDFPASRLQADFSLDRAVTIGLTQQGCTTLLGALRMAATLLTSEPDWQRVLCVGADRFPDGAGYEQAYNPVSDGAAACVVGREPAAFRLISAHQITNGGLVQASDDERVGAYFSYTRLLVTEALARAGLQAGDLAWVVPQNTNRAAWQIMARVLGIDIERVWQPSLPDVGHVTAADNLINLVALVDSGRLRPGERVLLLMAGHGLNWQSVILEATEEASR